MTQPRTTKRQPRVSPLSVFETRFNGSVIFPDDERYDLARRIWNNTPDRYPALIVRPTGAADVAEAIRFARAQGLAISVRGGGQAMAGLVVNDGGLLIDLSQLKQISVHPYQHTARVQPGVTVGEFVRATEPFNLATTVGSALGAGMAGLTLSGGIGWLMGKYGLTVDNLRSIEIVTADGQIRYANEEENGDLLWAVRGGGGNVGVVTEFTYQLHPFGNILGGMLSYPFDQVREVLSAYRDFTANAPDELTAYLSLNSGPDGRPVATIALAYLGPQIDGELSIAPLRRWLGRPIADTIRAMSHFELTSMLERRAPAERTYYQLEQALPALTDEICETLVAQVARRPSPLGGVMLQHVHGVAARIHPAATAAAGLRGEHYATLLGMAWDEGDGSPETSWVRAASAALTPFAREQVDVKLLEDIKSRFDPERVFDSNASISRT